jgi:hypothetical protein
MFHRGVKIQRKDHDAPPGGIFTKISRGELSSGQVVFHDGVHFFAFATPLTIPLDQLIAADIPVGDNSIDLVSFTAIDLNLIGIFGGVGADKNLFNPRGEILQ